MGDYLYDKYNKKLTTRAGAILIGVGGVILLLCAFLKYHFGKSFLSFTAPFSPLVAIASLLIFIGVINLDVTLSRFTVWLSNESFRMYLVHAFIIDLLSKIMFFVWGKPKFFSRSALVVIPAFSLIVLLLSALSVFIISNFKNIKAIRINSK